MNRKYLCAVILTVLYGCAAPINERIADNYAQIGVEAQARGDWDGARRAFAKSALNSDLAKASPQRRAIFHYEYGRSLGVTCFFEDAERQLNLAFEFDKQAGEPLYLSLVELARLMLDQKKFPQAITYFERAVPELDRADAEKGAPMAYAEILDEYASALAGVGREKDASTARKRASDLRGANPKGFSITDRTPYGKHCTKP